MTLETAIQNLQEAIDLNLSGGIEVTIPGQDSTEFIVNRPESIPNKIAYYREAYNADGTHKRNPQIRIVNARVCPYSDLFLLKHHPDAACG